MNLNDNFIIGTLIKSMLTELRTNYKYQYGFNSLLKCLTSTLKIKKKGIKTQIPNRRFEVLTFSVIPGLTKYWLNHMKSIKSFKNVTFTIGDCSGGLKINKNNNSKIRCIPYLNLSHGVKLDTFINKVCDAEYVLICDDDIFFSDSSPITYALNKFNQDPKLAAVSLYPRPDSKKRINEYSQIYSKNQFGIEINDLMGSYCLVIKKQVWIDEKLSFQQVKPKNWRSIGNFFDTCDYANYKLIDLGYNIIISPEKLQNKLVVFTSLSLWGLRIQFSQGEIDNVIRERPNEYEKAYQTAVTLLQVYKSIRRSKEFYNFKLIELSFILKALEQCERKLKFIIKDKIKNDVMKRFNKIKY